jgi:hypothetical protein
MLRVCGLVLLAVLALPSLAEAQETAAQSLYGVKEILVRPVVFDNPAIALSCRLKAEDVDEAIMREMHDNGLPAMTEADARPSTMDVARIILVPQIVPFNSQGLDCISWISLSAESRNHLRILPVEIPRIVNVVYWHRGEMAISAQSVHFEHVSQSLHAMIHDFGTRYNAAQPPKVGPVTPLSPR